MLKQHPPVAKTTCTCCRNSIPLSLKQHVPVVETAPPVVLATMPFQEQYIKLLIEKSLIYNQKIHFQLVKQNLLVNCRD
jgi:hypothetical protein